jgi:8-oxo-dGTP diphosphatase
MGRRKGTGEGSWGLPGGKQEFGESFRAAANREVLEETGIRLSNLEFVNVTNDPRPEREEHFIHLNFRAVTSIEPRLTEPDKFYEWQWFDLFELPEPIFFGHEKLMEAYKRGEILAD